MDRENELLDSFKRAWRKMIVEGTGDYFKREFEDRGIPVYFMKDGDPRIWVKDRQGIRPADPLKSGS